MCEHIMCMNPLCSIGCLSKVLKEISLISSEEIPEVVSFLLLIMALLEHFKCRLQKKIKKSSFWVKA